MPWIPRLRGTTALPAGPALPASQHAKALLHTRAWLDLLYMDAVEGVTIERSALVRKATIEFDLVRSDARARNASRDLILKVAEERWNT